MRGISRLVGGTLRLEGEFTVSKLLKNALGWSGSVWPCFWVAGAFIILGRDLVVLMLIVACLFFWLLFCCLKIMLEVFSSETL